jgi:organic radical activating enzyme
VQQRGQELKLVWPQAEFDLGTMARTGEFTHRFLQPMDGPDRTANTELCIAECMRDPVWRLSVQTHKITGIR